jgi:hypothetical protein
MSVYSPKTEFAKNLSGVNVFNALREFHSDFRLTAGRWSSTGDMN